MRTWVLAALLAVCVAPAHGPARAAEATAVDRLADEIAAKVAPLLEDGADVAVSARGEARLGAALRGRVAARLARGRTAEAFAGGAAAARKKGFEQWLDLDVSVKRGHVVVVATVDDTSFHPWRFAKARLGRVPRSAATTAAVDGDLRPLVSPAGTRKLAFRQQDGSLELGAPLLALGGADLDGDATAELIALTTREVVALRVGADETTILASFALNGAPATVRPRDPVGSLLVADVDGDGAPEVLARASETGAGVILGWQDGAFVREGDLANHPMCALTDETGAVHVLAAILADGVNWFPRDGVFVAPEWKGFAMPALPERFLAMRCAGDVVATVDADGNLRAGATTLSDAGVAFDLADVDGDGVAEVITSAWRAPGDGDVLTIHSAAGKALAKGAALRGGVAAIASGDFNGDGAADVVAFARLVDATRGDVWVLR